jgi:hypothetical protein
MLQTLASVNGWGVETEQSDWGVPGRLQYGTLPNLLVLDSVEEKIVSVLRWVRRLHANLPVVLIVPEGDTKFEQHRVSEL